MIIDQMVMITAPDDRRVRHKDTCCVNFNREEQHCCCAPGYHDRADTEHFRRYPLGMTDEQIRERYWLSQWGIT